MQVLLDKLGATIIVMTIALMIFEVNTRNGKTLSETSAYFSLITQTEAFAKILRRDLQGIERVLTTEEIPVGGGHEFRFVSRIGQDTTRHTIIYRREEAYERHGHTFYSIHRLVDGVADGGSAEILIDWAIQALNEDAGEIEDPENTAQVLVRFAAASPIMDAQVIERLEWESRFFPPMRNN